MNYNKGVINSRSDPRHVPGLFSLNSSSPFDQKQLQQQHQSQQPESISNETNSDAIAVELSPCSVHPYSSLAISPDGKYAVLASRDVLRFVYVESTKEMRQIRYIRVTSIFSQPSTTSLSKSQQSPQTVSLSKSQHGPVRADVSITNVAWSNVHLRQELDGSQASHLSAEIDKSQHNIYGRDYTESNQLSHSSADGNDSISSVGMQASLIAACASNGVVVIWRSKELFGVTESNGINANVGGKINQPEAVLAEHTRAVNGLAWHPTKYGLLLTASQDASVKIWEFDRPSKESQRKRESLNLRSLFGLSSGPSTTFTPSNVSHPKWRCVATIKPKSDAIRDIKWCPNNEKLFALVTDSGSLIVYHHDLLARPFVKFSCHSGQASCLDWHPRMQYVIATGSGREKNLKVWDLEEYFKVHKQDSSSGDYDHSRFHRSSSTVHYNTIGYNERHHVGSVQHLKRSMSAINLGYRPSAKAIHTLHIAAPVTHLKWRPPRECASLPSGDPHNSMVFVSTAPNSAAGGTGSIELWSLSRPFLPLSKVEGHSPGAVVDFCCVNGNNYEDSLFLGPSSSRPKWQHVISVGRDKRCLIQDFARGQRPIDQVPLSTFALGTLAPSETLRGSLQIVSVNQAVPSGNANDFQLTQLVCDINQRLLHSSNWRPKHQQIPDISPTLNSSIIDGYMINSVGISDMNKMIVAPELQYLSYFGRSYLMHVTSKYTTQSAVCEYNSEVAGKLDGYGPLARMWKLLSAMACDAETQHNSLSINPLSYALWPTIESLLGERTEAGDVQTCVVICEVFDIVHPPERGSNNVDVSVRVQGLSIEEIREWYSSYIDILHSMSLFSLATALIRECKDPSIAALNQKSTTIRESCPICSKPLQECGQKRTDTMHNGKPGILIHQPIQRCANCRQNVGHCFICNLPVTSGLFVLCPGCGHGGHMKCAMSWFSDTDGLGEEVCPTGCGHKCNLKKYFSCLPSDATFLSAEKSQ